jgi:hypothetical protein
LATQKFHIPGLTREDEGRVKAALMRRPGVLYAEVSHADACAEVDFEDDAITTDELREILARLGFAARLAG